jgi:hypothetical protein
VHPAVFAMQTFMSVEFMLTRAISRGADDGIYEATCIPTQCCLWLGSEVSRHLRLSAASGSGLGGFSFALTTDQKRTVSEQKSRHEVLGLKSEMKSMSAMLHRHRRQREAGERQRQQRQQGRQGERPVRLEGSERRLGEGARQGYELLRRTQRMV